MSEQQRLFEHYNPIEKRLGKDFFDELPTWAGIYKMYGQTNELLYVGKAKNLRNRLFTYRRAKMGNTSRKTIRLIRMTHRVDIERCDSEKEALLLENKLIRKHEPEFNYAKKQPETYYFIGLQRTQSGIMFSLQMHEPDLQHVYGAFKGHRIIRKALGGVIRILYMLEHQIKSVFELPTVLTQKLTPMRYELLMDAEEEASKIFWPHLQDYFLGKNTDLINAILEKCKNRDLLDTFAGSMILDDLEAMKWFYERCSHRNFQIMEHLERDSHLIAQHALDDLLIEWAFVEEE